MTSVGAIGKAVEAEGLAWEPVGPHGLRYRTGGGEHSLLVDPLDRELVSATTTLGPVRLSRLEACRLAQRLMHLRAGLRVTTEESTDGLRLRLRVDLRVASVEGLARHLREARLLLLTTVEPAARLVAELERVAAGAPDGRVPEAYWRQARSLGRRMRSSLKRERRSSLARSPRVRRADEGFWTRFSCELPLGELPEEQVLLWADQTMRRYDHLRLELAPFERRLVAAVDLAVFSEEDEERLEPMAQALVRSVCRLTPGAAPARELVQ